MNKMLAHRLTKMLRRSSQPTVVLGSLTVILSLLLSFILNLGSGAVAQSQSSYGMVDPVADDHAVGYQIYIERCATCHVALPPAVLPVEAWQSILTDRAHYGVSLPAIPRFDQRLMLNYLQTYARRYQGRGATPYRLENSDFFLAFHPNVELPQSLNLRSCAGCHLSASEQNYTGASKPSL